MLFKAVFLALVPTILAANHAVTVGADNSFVFNPTSVVADVGDTVTFTFMSRNHSSTTTNFSGAVCPPPAGGVGTNGWDSGFLPATTGSTPGFVYTVIDTEPHFAACMQNGGAHCRIGMTFALNPTEEQTYAQFNANAIASELLPTMFPTIPDRE
ncbi:hypothetical protein C8J57DRAFT_1612222 [Mycena rebaudengoi]|nr:hypothetical protein C8J57DRAFT_1583209 [Mycena rebaudengoi]KAJ7241067.1 hypothetical protein C8J57DRAFT_1561679 [Mycena rebaudengoi]KAJ7268313.1 hypothetical protein C8J57DRAFT_1612222 [Mycena rebaudengoi]